ncbi:metal ABC transporter permease [Parvibaculum sp.]|uniref:metal ABC transporter permease n=1 Tax=Parvibaculum sp. TaxID=2024848 RepID=UPI000C58CBE5|nr:metal ABC transporter permease [Parvibaculum sp.]MAU59744.1 zinc ABC transporter permease [Parvibaculum sp.]MAU59763.1 zinc ABC transporter permease [Parvibaculum sp.]MBO6667732.1 metal ABC transporter permease [Parvibaculum sp.]MBO6693322.1 metal ABC transporter permease [Parvibaculum sp.]MBO6715183.1 metal ABC transporter permease [Parvibaculum sp.]|tara:strand:+ start:4372 stop:5241 length:870 start_codon:yes stop_codon:yes gene_type:complete
MIYDALIAPFVEYGFMRRSLIACLALAIGGGPIGTFLVLRRMSLMGDAMSHALLPGAAIGFLIAGLSLWTMSIGGLVAGLTVAFLAGLVSRVTALREDASLAGFYLISLALGVLIVSTQGSNVDLLHVLFGTILSVTDEALILVASIATLTVIALALIYRPLVIECFDPAFLRATTGGGTVWHFLFLVLVVVNLVAGFQALGTLMALGLMMLPAAAARFWAGAVWSLAALSTALAFLSGLAGLLLSYNFNLPSGPAIILTAGMLYLGSILLGTRDSLRTRYFPRAHFHD